jgi:uncharacterized membrane protein YphA (DoxX/SURF4 family)
LQRFFSTFPGGLPGLGLLLLRLAIGAAIVARGWAFLAERSPSTFATESLGLFAILIGCALLFGLFTPAASAIAALGLGLLGHPARDLATLFLIVMAASSGLLGPGAFSLDARLFGRREIVVPRRNP